MADDVAGAVRRTPRPTPRAEDHQTPETATPVASGATNTSSAPVDTGDTISSRVSPQDASGRNWTLGDDTERPFGDLEGPRTDPVGTVRQHDDGSTAVKVAMGNDTGKGQHVWCEMTLDLAVRWLAHDEVAEWATEREARLAELRALVAADPGALFQLGHVHDTSNDMQAFLELPDCEACGGTGKDDHASPFEAPLAVHFAGPPVEIVGRRRQLCMWCGHVLRDSPRAGDNAMQPWPVGVLVRIEDGIATLAPHEPGGELPPGCCALPDDEDITDLDPLARDLLDDLCGKHVEGTSSNRCRLRTGHPGDCSDEYERLDGFEPGPGCYPPVDGWDGASIAVDDGPSHAQETRAAADWPPDRANPREVPS